MVHVEDISPISAARLQTGTANQILIFFILKQFRSIEMERKLRLSLRKVRKWAKVSGKVHEEEMGLVNLK